MIFFAARANILTFVSRYGNIIYCADSCRQYGGHDISRYPHTKGSRHRLGGRHTHIECPPKTF